MKMSIWFCQIDEKCSSTSANNQLEKTAKCKFASSVNSSVEFHRVLSIDKRDLYIDSRFFSPVRAVLKQKNYKLRQDKNHKVTEQTK